MFDSFVFLPLSTRAYFKGRAYIKIILKNHARSYFAGRSYYRGNTIFIRYANDAFCNSFEVMLCSFQVKTLPTLAVSIAVSGIASTTMRCEKAKQKFDNFILVFEDLLFYFIFLNRRFSWCSFG